MCLASTPLWTQTGSGRAAPDCAETSRWCQGSLLLDTHLSLIGDFKKNCEINFSWQPGISQIKCIWVKYCKKNTREKKKRNEYKTNVRAEFLISFYHFLLCIFSSSQLERVSFQCGGRQVSTSVANSTLARYPKGIS